MNETNNQALRGQIAKKLMEIGITPGTTGYYGLVEAVDIAYPNPARIARNGMTTILYPEVAKRLDTTPTRAERCIRHSIEILYNTSGPDDLKIFGKMADINKGKMTNTAFICSVAQMLRIENGEV